VTISQLLAVLAQRLAESGDLEVTLFDGETCDYYPVVEASTTMSYTEPRHDVLVLREGEAPA
jgi:hypothetical protein